MSTTTTTCEFFSDAEYKLARRELLRRLDSSLCCQPLPAFEPADGKKTLARRRAFLSIKIDNLKRRWLYGLVMAAEIAAIEKEVLPGGEGVWMVWEERRRMQVREEEKAEYCRQRQYGFRRSPYEGGKHSRPAYWDALEFVAGCGVARKGWTMEGGFLRAWRSEIVEDDDDLAPEEISRGVIAESWTPPVMAPVERRHSWPSRVGRALLHRQGTV